MSRQTTKTLLPELRFPEFRDSNEWQEKQLRNVCQMQAGKFVNASDIAERMNIGLYPCYGGNGLRGYTKSYTNDGDYSLIGRQGALCGNITLVTGKFHATEHAVVVTPKEGVDTDWLFYALVYLNLNQYATGQAQPGLSVENLEGVEIKIPTTEKEQLKIADCLSSIDSLIVAQNEKLAALKAHKKGLMQQLFPADGESVPKVRFGEFRDGTPWVDTSVGEECKSYSGGTPSTVKKEFYSGNIPFIRSAEIDKDQTELFLTEEGLKNSAAKLVNKGDVLYALYGANSGEVSLARQSGAINQAVLCLRSDCNPFIYQFLSFKKNWVVAKYIQGGQGNLSGEIVKSISIRVPKPEEQQKIADCLSSIDELITAQTQKIEALKEHKKGLMQQLFPSVRVDESRSIFDN